jgi:hypothetical protein
MKPSRAIRHVNKECIANVSKTLGCYRESFQPYTLNTLLTTAPIQPMAVSAIVQSLTSKHPFLPHDSN